MLNVLESTSSSSFRSPPSSKRRLPLPTTIGWTMTELVEEVLLQQRPDEGAAARDPDVLARLPLELVDLLRDVPADERRVVPPERLLQGRGDDVFAHTVHVDCSGVLLRVLLRLEVGPLFVVYPPHQHGVRLAHSSSDLLSHLLVEVREVPFLRRLHDAVQRHELRRHDSPHKYLLRSILQTLTRPCIGHRGHAGDRARPTTTTSSHARPYGPSHSRSILPPRKTVMVEPL